ncbi:MAG: hypothetical protein ACRCZB_04295 [Bacteroidales bacterium]
MLYLEIYHPLLPCYPTTTYTLYTLTTLTLPHSPTTVITGSDPQAPIYTQYSSLTGIIHTVHLPPALNSLPPSDMGKWTKKCSEGGVKILTE